MKVQEAIELLEAPAGDIDANLRAEAERCIAENPEAAAELDRRRQADFRIRGVFASIAVPADLKSTCLALYDAAMAPEPVTVGVPRRFFLRPWMYAAAAAVAIFLLVQAPLHDSSDVIPATAAAPSNVSHAGVSSLLNDLGRQFGSFGNYHHRPEGILGAASYFAEKGAPVNDFLTSGFANVVPDGCRILDVQGYRVSMICLRTEPFMHLFVVPREAAGEMALSGPIESKVHSVSFLAWVDGEQLLILATRSGSCDDLKRHAAVAFAH
jgi:hypothetical protein